MKVSKVQTQLCGEDILSIINEFVKVDGLELQQIIIDNELKLIGQFNKKLNMNFEISVEIQGVKNGIIYGRFSKLKAMKLGFFRPFRSLALKIAVKKLELKGIKTDKDRFELDIDKLLLDVPFISVSIADIFVKNQLLHLEVENINISIKGELIKEKEEEILEEEVVSVEPINKVEDDYTIGRKFVESKMSQQIKRIADYLFIIPDIVALIYRLLKDKRVSRKTKIILGISVTYIVSPIDFIPDVIPFIGKIDDLAIICFALNRIITDVPLNVILENWQGKNELVVVLKSGLEYIINFTGAKNVEKLYNVVQELTQL